MGAMRGEKLLTASDLAALCEVDLKTIHNWVDRGKIAHFRTPGRHLRFRAADVTEFLRAWGYTVPRELARASARSVIVVGGKEAMTHVTSALDSVAARYIAHPYDALVQAGIDAPDVFVLDVVALTPQIDVARMFEALHRACARSMLVALADDFPGMPSFVIRVGRSDESALKKLGEPTQSAVSSSGASDDSARSESSSSPRSAGDVRPTG